MKAEDFGISPIPAQSVSPPSGMSKGQFSASILEAKALTPATQMVLANAALLFYLAGSSSDVKQCYLFAEEVLMSGKVQERMTQIRGMLPV